MSIVYSRQLHRLNQRIARQPVEFRPEGRVVQVNKDRVSIEGLQPAIGSRCTVLCSSDERVPLGARVIATYKHGAILAIDSSVSPVPGDRVLQDQRQHQLPSAKRLRGRVVDAFAKPVDGAGMINPGAVVSGAAPRRLALDSARIDTRMSTGVRAIDALLPLGYGQRVGLLAASGVGKTELMGMLAQHVNVDRVVVALVGERGREVVEFVTSTLDEKVRQKSIVVAEPAGSTALRRRQCAETAMRLAEDFRSQGQSVLLLLDSLSRYADACRELALAAGEPAGSDGFPASVMQSMINLIERAGMGVSGEGSISLIATLLLAADERINPVADCARAVLDGHIVLSSELANQGIYPAIDPLASVSRLADSLQQQVDYQAAGNFRRFYATWIEQRDLVLSGMYQRGASEAIDRAIACWPLMLEFIQQHRSEYAASADSLLALRQLFHNPETPGFAEGAHA